MPVNLLDLNKEEFQKFLESFDHVFSDCDGVIWNEKEALPRVGEFFNLMKKHGKRVHFVSNSSMRSIEDYEDRFKKANVDFQHKCLTIPSVAIAEYLKDQNVTKKVFCVTNDQTKKTLESYGLDCVSGPEVPFEHFQDYEVYSKKDPEIGAVVFDFDYRINLAKLHRAIAYLKNPETLFLCGATDRHLHFKKGCTALSCGYFTELVGAETNRAPIVLGKPGKAFGEFAMKRARITDPSRVLFIGDMIEQDVGVGKATGFKTLLLLANITKETMNEHKTLKPDYYADSLESIVPLL